MFALRMRRFQLIKNNNINVRHLCDKKNLSSHNKIKDVFKFKYEKKDISEKYLMLITLIAL